MKDTRRNSSSNAPSPAHGPTEIKLTHVRAPSQPFNELILKVLALFTLPVMFISMTALINETGALATFKALLITGSACIAAYAVNVIAVRHLAPMWAINFRSAGIVAIVGIVITGSGLFIASLFGLTNGPVNYRILDDHGIILNRYVAKTNDFTLQVAHIAPGTRLVAEDISRTSICETRVSCLSKQGNGGRGDMAIALEESAGSAHAIADAFDSGTVERKRILDALNRLNSKYQDVLADQNLDSAERRAALQGIHGKIAQSANALTAALPVALLKSFAQELQAGAIISGNPTGSQRLSAYLRDHGNTLTGLIAELPENDLTPPNFPKPPGMWDSLTYLADFAALGIVIFIAELVVPMTIFIMTYLTLVWEIEKRTPRNDDDNDTPDKFGGLHDPISPRPNGHDATASRGH